jgi:cytochrome c-type biogenesis protein CcmH/NrfF
MSFATYGINAILWVLQVIALIVGVVLTAMARRNHGRAALMGMFGCIVLLLGVIASVVQSLFLPSLARDLGDMMAVIMIFSVIHVLLWLVGFGLLLAGVVMRRPVQPQQPQQPYYQQPPPPPGYSGY